MPAARQGRSFLFYTGAHQLGVLTNDHVSRRTGKHPAFENARWTFEVIDPWAMTVVSGEHQGTFHVSIPEEPYQVVRATPWR